jgi:hypothetical protein
MKIRYFTALVVLFYFLQAQITIARYMDTIKRRYLHFFYSKIRLYLCWVLKNFCTLFLFLLLLTSFQSGYQFSKIYHRIGRGIVGYGIRQKIVVVNNCTARINYIGYISSRSSSLVKVGFFNLPISLLGSRSNRMRLCNSVS